MRVDALVDAGSDEVVVTVLTPVVEILSVVVVVIGKNAEVRGFKMLVSGSDKDNPSLEFVVVVVPGSEVGVVVVPGSVVRGPELVVLGSTLVPGSEVVLGSVADVGFVVVDGS